MKAESAIRRKQETAMDVLIEEYIREMKLAAGLDRQRVSEAWDMASGAGRYTLGREFRNGKLTVTVSSSVIRSRLYLQKDVILRKLNGILAEDSLFSGIGEASAPVRDIILK